MPVNGENSAFDLICDVIGSTEMEASNNNNNVEVTPDAMDVDQAPRPEKMFALKKWNAVAMWRWDVECDTCAICRAQVMGEFPGIAAR
ncbi:RING-box protein 2 [Amphibalanus amphitrite]|uniref:RING-box protein 2 n=1 Tax=Amphibalanus amphitrite TaxID=1232801 RepID=A0A6A4VV20_AMPAM|nr:RING-box protein 2 [Amphibalanus amphitrite]